MRKIVSGIQRIVVLFLKEFLLPVITPALLIVFLYLAYQTYYFFDNYYYPGLNTSDDSYDVEHKNWWVDINVDTPVKIDKNQFEIPASLTGINVYERQSSKNKIQKFCITYLLFGKEDFQQKLTGNNEVYPQPNCFAMTSENKHPIYSSTNEGEMVIDPQYYSYSLEVNELIDSSTIEYSGVQYPLDKAEYHLYAWLKYSIQFDDNHTEEGVISPYLSISGVKNIMEGNWEVYVTGKDQVIQIPKGFPPEIAGKSFHTSYYTVLFERPFVFRSLFLVVFALIFCFIGVTFFIKKADVFLASILVILFGLISIKPLFPVPENLSTSNISLTDFLILFSFVFLGISGVNFLINRALHSEALEKPMPVFRKRPVIKKVSQRRMRK